MEQQEKIINLFERIQFFRRYELLCQKFQFDDTFKNFSSVEVVKIIKVLGYDAKFIKSDNYVKIEKNFENMKFYLHLILKYGIVETVVGSRTSDDQPVISDVFRLIYKLDSSTKNQSIANDIRQPKFRNYSDLKDILNSTFDIFEDFITESLAIENS